MNKHILMLAKQSGLIQYESDGKMEEVEKFAELIILECAEVAGKTRWAVPPTQEQIASSIRQHFGVSQ